MTVEYLRRLHPSASGLPGEARLDRPPRFGAACPVALAEPPIAAAVLPPPPVQVASPQPMPAAAVAAPAAGPGLAETSRRVDADAFAPPPRRAPTPAAPRDAAASEPPPSDAPASAAAPAVRVQSSGPSPAAERQAARPAVPRPPALPEPPRRADAVAARADRPEIVQVTIERIDVRLPAAPVPAPRRPRPASAVEPLADYLRSTGPR